MRNGAWLRSRLSVLTVIGVIAGGMLIGGLILRQGDDRATLKFYVAGDDVSRIARGE